MTTAFNQRESRRQCGESGGIPSPRKQTKQTNYRNPKPGIVSVGTDKRRVRNDNRQRGRREMLLIRQRAERGEGVGSRERGTEQGVGKQE